MSPAAEPVPAHIGIDLGKSGGDHNALCVRCDCGRLLTMTWSAGVRIKIVHADCECGKRIPIDQDFTTDASGGADNG